MTYKNICKIWWTIFEQKHCLVLNWIFLELSFKKELKLCWKKKVFWWCLYALKIKKHSLVLLLLWQLPFKGWRQSQIFANQNGPSRILSILSTFPVSSSVACLSCVILHFGVLGRSFKVVTGGVAVRHVINQVSNITDVVSHSRREVRLRWNCVLNMVH